MEPEFLLDEVLEEKQNKLEEHKQELQRIIESTHNPKLEKKAMFLKSFVRGMMFALRQQKKLLTVKSGLLPPELPEIPPMPPKEKLMPKQQMQKAGLAKQSVRLPLANQLQSHPAFVPINKLAEKIKEIKPLKKELIRKELITDKFTKNVLATAVISSKYIVNEPELDENDRKAMEKISGKKPKSVKKIWKLIVRYAKKFRIQSGHQENLKYHLINRFFTLGKIEPLLHDEEITQISCSGVGKPVVVVHKQQEFPTNISFNDAHELQEFLDIVAERTKQKLDRKHPVLDVAYRNFRVHIILGVQAGNSKFNFKRLEI